MEQIHEDKARLPTAATLPRAPRSPDAPSWQSWWSAFVAAYGPFLRRIAAAEFRRSGAWRRADDSGDDAVQGFMVALMARGLLSRDVDVRSPRRFLRVLLVRHIRSTHRRLRATKRGGGRSRVDADFDRIPSPQATSARRDEAPQWLQQAIESALLRLQANAGEACSELIRDMMRTRDGGRTSPDFAERLGLHLQTLAVRKHRARRALLRELAHVLLELSPTPEVARDRYHWIQRQALRRPPPPKRHVASRARCLRPPTPARDKPRAA